MLKRKIKLPTKAVDNFVDKVWTSECKP